VVTEQVDAGDQGEDISPHAARSPSVTEGILGRHLWGRGYFAATTGNVSDEVVAKYIEDQDVNPQEDEAFKISDGGPQPLNLLTS
jgi:hypothetical protein